MPSRLEAVILRMLEKQAVARPTATEVEAELTKVSTALLEPAGTGSSGLPRAQPRREHNLPSQHTTLVGRAAELDSVKDMLLHSRVRLLTLTGPGGTGKTRLAIQVATDVVDQFNGVSFVNLAPITDASLVASAVARSLGVRETGDLPLDESHRPGPSRPRPGAAAHGQLRAGLRCRRPSSRNCWTRVPRSRCW